MQSYAIIDIPNFKYFGFKNFFVFLQNNVTFYISMSSFLKRNVEMLVLLFLKKVLNILLINE